MRLSGFIFWLQRHPNHKLNFILPDGRFIPAHFHITEVGHVNRRFIDCGGTVRQRETCLLQTWVAEDTDHRLKPGRLAKIFEMARPILPDTDLEMEVEYEDSVTGQFTVKSAATSENTLSFLLEVRHTDCLAKELCLIPPAIGEQKDGCCVTGVCC